MPSSQPSWHFTTAVTGRKLTHVYVNPAVISAEIVHSLRVTLATLRHRNQQAPHQVLHVHRYPSQSAVLAIRIYGDVRRAGFCPEGESVDSRCQCGIHPKLDCPLT